MPTQKKLTEISEMKIAIRDINQKVEVLGQAFTNCLQDIKMFAKLSQEMSIVIQHMPGYGEAIKTLDKMVEEQKKEDEAKKKEKPSFDFDAKSE